MAWFRVAAASSFFPIPSRILDLVSRLSKSLFILDGCFFVFEGVVHIEFVVDQIRRRIIVSPPCVLRKSAELVVQAGLHNLIRVHADLEWDCELLPQIGRASCRERV